MVNEEQGEMVVEVRMVNNRVMAVVLLIERDVLKQIYRHASQGERSLEEKPSFYDELKGQWEMHSADDLVMHLGDFNGYMGGNLMGFSVGQRNLEGGMLLEFCLEKELCVKYMV